MKENEKFKLLSEILDYTAFNQAIIFSNTVQKTIALSQKLTEILFNPITIHSDLTQETRIKTYETFKNNGSRLLVATDLFGRGIDIKNVNLVINYDCPRRPEEYLHRVGRASRFGTSGVVITFLDENRLMEERNMLDQYGHLMNSDIDRMPANLRPYM